MKFVPTQSWLAPLAMLLSSSAAIAQNAPTQPRVAAAGAGTIVLTPFEVSSASDNGYAATETLAGTRLRTELRDIGASLSILTPEFMRDLGVNSFDQALLYTPSVDASEGDNTDNNRASGNQMRFGTGQSYSIRGFNTNAGNQSASHDFFTALDPAD
jgi:outer membrane receptor for ferric coprogen and ferric-rhodotorulic acid